MPTLAPSPACHALEAPRVLDLITADTARIAALIAEADPGRPVPSCPKWTLADLVEHAGEIHRWATAIVTRLPQQRIDLSPEQVAFPKDAWSTAPEWFAAGGAALVEALGKADLDAPCYAWGGDQHVRFWLRRMLHETAIHRVDAELAVLGEASPLDAAVAVDNVDEFLGNVPYTKRFRPAVRELHGDGETIHLHATDLDDSPLPGEWLITLEPHGFRWSHAHVKGAAAVRGTASDLALWINRRKEAGAAGLELLGEEPLLAYWSAKTAF
ncbi:MAG TPA: maleylpyruvate isomerase family mycothiol-dependent enzyme [Actinospica sp.]|nr:maleylpyruvate isomerase family mycothiol-dependent enzyme [Actinospica sp.]